MRKRKNNIDDERILFFSEAIRKRLNKNLKSIILFGSRARGDYTEDSDYDFAIILNDKTTKSINDIRRIEVDFLNRYDELTSSLIYDEKEWMRRLKMPIGINIMREGVHL
ncbi:MAG: nucleotidyltransferase domain-containing protein [Bacteroidetes bacterium]|nr:MAG: nucleotidyltransferase domain-containing protein [Bacteroidota bacterium]